MFCLIALVFLGKMKISSINNSYIPLKINFKALQQNKRLDLPNSNDYELISHDYFCKKQLELQDKYRVQLQEICFPDGKLNNDIKKFLDETKFEFEKFGVKDEKTIGEKLSEAILTTQYCEGDLYHATFTSEVANKIIKEGFNPEYISRTKCGPGFYFTSSEGDARNYGSCVLKVFCKGKQARMKNDYYNDILNKSDISTKLKDYLNFKSINYSTGHVQSEICTRIINEYCRNYIANELGIDITYASSGSTCAIVVHNLDAISDIHQYTSRW